MSNVQRGRVAFYLHTVFNGGIERVYYNLGLQLKERGWQVDLVLNSFKGSYFANTVPKELNVVDLDVKFPAYRPWALAKYLGEQRPNAVISATHFSNEVAVLAEKLARSGARIIVSEHTTLSVELGRLSFWHPRRLGISRLAKWAYPRAAARVTVSNGSAHDLAAFLNLPREAFTTVYNPALASDILPRSREPVAHPWLNGEGPPVILGVGRLEPQKNFDNLLRAFALLRKEREARLLILGEGSERRRLEERVTALGLNEDVQLFGFVDNPFAFLAKAAVFALSSDWEGLPTVLLEALAVGTPVVSTNCPSGPQEILDGGRFGKLVPLDDSRALAEGIGAVLSGEYRPEDPTEWLEQFTVPYATDRYERLLLGSA